MDKGKRTPQTLICEKGRRIFSQRDPSHQAFFMESGRAEVTVLDRGRNVKIAEIHPGEIFGEMGILQDRPRSATVITLEPSTIIVISKEDINDRIAAITDPIVKSLIEVLIRRLRGANESALRHYGDMAALQDRLMGLSSRISEGIDQSQRDAFTEEILPLLKGMEDILLKYSKKG